MSPSSFLRWLLSFLGFPLGGLVVVTLFRMTGAGTAVAGGLLAGLVLGGAQLVAGRPFGLPRSWVPATSLGLAAGSGVAALVVGTGPELWRLTATGAIAGWFAGAAQGLGRPAWRVLAWAGVSAVAFAAGWAVTTSIGVDVERGYVVFGSSGAVVATLLLGLALPLVARRPVAAPVAVAA